MTAQIISGIGYVAPIFSVIGVLTAIVFGVFSIRSNTKQLDISNKHFLFESRMEYWKLLSEIIPRYFSQIEEAKNIIKKIIIQNIRSWFFI